MLANTCKDAKKIAPKVFLLLFVSHPRVDVQSVIPYLRRPGKNVLPDHQLESTARKRGRRILRRLEHPVKPMMHNPSKRRYSQIPDSSRPGVIQSIFLWRRMRMLLEFYFRGPQEVERTRFDRRVDHDVI